MEDVNGELQALENISSTYGHDREWDMFLFFQSKMIDYKLFRLVREYAGTNPRILKLKKAIK